MSFFLIFFIFEQDTITNGKDNKKPRPLYDVPYMFEAREFLRKKLIGKKVKKTLSYFRNLSENWIPERISFGMATSNTHLKHEGAL